MDTGSGDSILTRPFHAEKTSKTNSVASLPEDLSQLHLEDNQPKADRVQSTNSSDDSTSDEDESDITPICSYPYGYIKRQTVYTCLTCNDPSKPDWTPAGICIGCRYACHQGHDLVSMETRRNFRCDCGNEKFSTDSPCILYPQKDARNECNTYNANYKGTFCSCNCKETDCAVDDPLYQCVVCEDWFHAGHSSAITDGIENNYTDLICGGCIPKLDFLRFYDPFDASAPVDDNAITEMMKLSEIDESDLESDSSVSKSCVACKLTTLTKKPAYTSGQLWTLGWRGKLCRCEKCKEMYESLNVSFLIDKEDETRRYFDQDDDEEEENQEKICQLVQKFEEWLFRMDPVERSDTFQLEPEQVKDKLRAYFSKIKEETGEDLLFEDALIDQLFDSFAEFILGPEGGADYLMDMDALKTALNQPTPSAGDDNVGEGKSS